MTRDRLEKIEARLVQKLILLGNDGEPYYAERTLCEISTTELRALCAELVAGVRLLWNSTSACKACGKQLRYGARLEPGVGWVCPSCEVFGPEEK